MTEFHAPSPGFLAALGIRPLPAGERCFARSSPGGDDEMSGNGGKKLATTKKLARVAGEGKA